MPVQTINPANGKIEKTFAELTDKEIPKIIERSHNAFLNWKETGFEERSKLMRNAASVLRNKKEEYGQVLTTEMGKTFIQACAEVEKCAWVCDYYADNAARILRDEIIETDASESFVSFDPLGVILAVMPWNFPFWQVFRFAAPAIMAGNVGILKQASNVPMCALAIEQIFLSAGFPEYVFKTILIGSKAVAGVIDHPHVILTFLIVIIRFNYYYYL